MTALVFYFTDHSICLAMDALSLDIEKHPFKLVSKFVLLPHLQSIICGTGVLGLIPKWIEFIQTSMVFGNITQLSMATSNQLKKIYEEMSIPSDITSTIYHFGLDKITNTMVGYAFRSTKAFQMEKLDYGLGVKPTYPVKGAIVPLQPEEIEPKFIDLITQLKEVDDNLPIKEKLGIGGEIHFARLNKKGMYFVKILHQFPDINTVYGEMLNNPNVKQI